MTNGRYGRIQFLILGYYVIIAGMLGLVEVEVQAVSSSLEVAFSRRTMNCEWAIFIAYFVGFLIPVLAALLATLEMNMAKKRVKRIKGDGG